VAGLDSLTDPLGGYNFIVNIVDSSSVLMVALSNISSVALGGFSECSGLESTLELESYQEGGNNGTTLKFPTRIEYGPIRLKHGVGLGDSLWKWHNDFILGRGKRRDGMIILQNDDHVPLKIWVFRRGIPAKFVGPSLNAMEGQVAIEELEIAHEGLALISPHTVVSSLLATVGIGA
jgi:phage tail-like protein